MTVIQGSPWPLLVLIWPLLLAMIGAMPRMRAQALRMLPLAPVPALVLALFPAGMTTQVPDLLLGLQLEVTATGRLLLGMTALVWIAAGLFAQGYLDSRHKPAIFHGFWCLTLSGNLGVFLAADVITFYVAFAAVSLAAYALVVHEGGDDVLFAGRVYLTLAVVGEACLLLGLLIGAAAADSLVIAEVTAALPTANLGMLAVVLLTLGFGLKAGLFPLHVWLPLAHPAAPTPASAVLSGAIVKAGIMGLLLFLPAATSSWLETLVVLGLAGGFLGALLGLTQRHPKAILAYSTVSQMSLLVALIAAALQQTESLAPAVYYAWHHGLVKAGMFLAIGGFAACSARWRLPAMVLLALGALSIAGLPLTGGSLTKTAAKATLTPTAEVLFGLSSLTTTLLLSWFLWRLWRSHEPAAQAPNPWLLGATTATLLIALLSPWWLWGSWADLPWRYYWQASNLWSLAWPLLMGVGLVAVFWRRAPGMPQWPAGDVLLPALAALRRVVPPLQALGELLQQPDRWRQPLLAAARGRFYAVAAKLSRQEAVLRHWRYSGLAVVVLAWALFFALA